MFVMALLLTACADERFGGLSRYCVQVQESLTPGRGPFGPDPAFLVSLSATQIQPEVIPE
jgi:hypothetical protein